ncbi:MAG: HU family DNA-binding protein [Thermoleophilia bacterium]
MTKAEFIDEVASKTGLTKAAAGDAVNAVLAAIEDALASGEDVAFTGFGKFSVQARAARTGVNPRTGEKVKIPAAKVPKFTAGAQLKEKVKAGKKAAKKK